jgi:hypothetical protein
MDMTLSKHVHHPTYFSLSLQPASMRGNACNLVAVCLGEPQIAIRPRSETERIVVPRGKNYRNASP